MTLRDVKIGDWILWQARGRRLVWAVVTQRPARKWGHRVGWRVQTPEGRIYGECESLDLRPFRAAEPDEAAALHVLYPPRMTAAVAIAGDEASLETAVINAFRNK